MKILKLHGSKKLFLSSIHKDLKNFYICSIQLIQKKREDHANSNVPPPLFEFIISNFE